MRGPSVALFAGVLLAGAVIAGCGGGGGGQASSPVPPGLAASASVQVKIVIPSAASIPAAVRKPSYVSPSVKSVVVAIMNGTTSLNAGNDYVNVTSTTSGCSTASGATICTLNVPANISASGSYTVIIGTYDANQSISCIPKSTPACVGNLLSISNLPQTITLGSTTVLKVTLGGIPAYIQPYEFLSGYIGPGSAGRVTLYGKGPMSAAFELLDAQKNVILGPGAPTISFTSSNPAALAIALSTPNASGQYVATVTPQTITSAAGPVVQPTTVPVNATISIPNTTLSQTLNGAFGFIIAHSAIYVVQPGFAGAHDASCNTPAAGITVEAYLDGNSTSSQGGYCTGAASNLGLAIDPVGDLWIADSSPNNNLVEFPPYMGTGAQGPGPTITPGPGNALNFPAWLAIDAIGDFYVSNVGGSGTSVTEYDVPSPGQTPNFSTTVNNYLSGTSNISPAYIDVDSGSPVAAAPHVYLAEYNSTAPAPGYSVVAFNHGTTSPIALPFTGTNSLDGLCVEPFNNYLWELTDPVSTDTATLINPSNSMTLPPTITGLNVNSWTCTVDELGNIYVPLSSGGPGIAEYSPPSFSTPTMILTGITKALDVAVYPGHLIGNDAGVGVAPIGTPPASPIPLPTF